jgi:hypothetical protein
MLRQSAELQLLGTDLLFESTRSNILPTSACAWAATHSRDRPANFDMQSLKADVRDLRQCAANKEENSHATDTAANDQGTNCEQLCLRL